MSFVGRQADLAAIGDVVDDAIRGRGSLTLVCGEPGIGKTALVEEAAQAASAKGATVRWASCWEGEGQPPYWPWLQVVRAELPTAPAGSGVAELLLRQAGAGDTTRFELFDALARFLTAAAAQGPRMVVLDDLHWADASSLQFLLFLARQLRQAAVAVVATCRDVDVDPASPMLELFPDLCRLARVLRLDALSDPEIAALLEGSGAAAGADQVAEVSRQSGGNPLFASELARLRQSRPMGSEEVPLGLREVIRRRLSRFDDATTALLEAAAVLGQRFDTAELAKMSVSSEADVLERLVAPLAARLLGGDSARSELGFAHDLVRRTLYEGLGVVHRAELHGRAADAIAAAGPAALNEHAGRVAFHRVAAAALGNRAAAVAACRAASDQARRELAHDEAAGYLRTAVRLTDEGTSPEGAASGELALALAEAEWRAGRQQAAVAAAERALAEARRRGDDVIFARAALACCLGAPVFKPRPDLVGLLDEARHRLADREPALLARILARQSVLLLTVRPAEPESVADQAVDAARRARDDVALAEALQARHQAIWTEGRTDERAAIAAELVDIAGRSGNRDLAVEAALMRFVIAMDTGDGDEVDQRLAEVTALAESLRRPLWRFYAATRTGAVALARGEFANAERAIDQAEAVAPEGLGEAQVVLMGARLRLALLRGDRAALSAQMERLRVLFPLGRAGWTPGSQAALSMVVLGHEEQARSLVDRLMGQMDELGARLFSVLPGAFALTEVCLRLGMTDHLPALYRVLAPHEGAVATLAGGVQAFGPVAHALGCLAAAQGRTDVAVAHFATSLAVAERMRSPAWAAATKAAWADALAAGGDSEGAARLRGEARGMAEALGLAQVLVALGAPGVDPPAPTVAEARLRIEGDHWRVALGPETTRLRDSKGLRYLAELVAHPGVERHALDLVAVTEGASTEPGLDRRRIGDAGAMLDPTAKEAYRRRLEDLRDDVAEAEAFHDGERAARAQAEIDALVQELSRAVGLGGRDRRAASAAERARLNVTRALRAAIARVEESLPRMGRHLDRCVRTGMFCAYEPDGQLRVRVER